MKSKSLSYYNPILIALIAGIPWWAASFDNALLSTNLLSIATVLGYTKHQVSLVLSIFIIISAMFLIMWGRFGDKLGQHTVLKWASIGYTISSFLAIFTVHYFFFLITLRIIQGFFVAGLMANSSPLAVKLVHPTSQRLTTTWMIGIFGFGAALGILLGPWIVPIFHFRLFFIIEMVLGIVCYIGSLRIKNAPITKNDIPIKFLVLGIITAVLLLIELMIDYVNYPIMLGIFFLIMVILIVVMIFVERNSSTPLIHASIVKNISFYIYNFAFIVFGIVYIGLLLFLPSYIIRPPLLGYEISWIVTGLPLSFAISGIFISPFIVKLPIKRVSLIGILTLLELLIPLGAFLIVSFVSNLFLYLILIIGDVILYGIVSSSLVPLLFLSVMQMGGDTQKGLLGGIARTAQMLGFGITPIFFTLIIGNLTGIHMVEKIPTFIFFMIGAVLISLVSLFFVRKRSVKV